jgi:hypothetical protein
VSRPATASAVNASSPKICGTHADANPSSSARRTHCVSSPIGSSLRGSPRKSPIRTAAPYAREDDGIDPTSFRTGALRGVVVPGAFVVLAVAVALAAPDGPTIAVCVVIAVLSLVWLVRAARVGVQLRDDGVAVHAVARTRTIPWSRIERARVVRLRGRTTLALELTGGKTRRIEELSAIGDAAAIVVQAAAEISRRVQERSR